MIIISGKLYVEKALRDKRVFDHQEMVRRARRHPGCLDLIIAADPIEEDRINDFEQWESEEVLADWRKVANPPRFTFDQERSNVQKHLVSRSAPPF
jgi:quinol monooxygenase YgiN